MRIMIAFLGLSFIPAGMAHAQRSDTAWTIRGGTYDGDTVLIQHTAATGKSSRFWRLTRSGAEQRVVGWLPSRLPVAVAFRNENGISRADSAAFWRILGRIEADAGLRLFTPAALADEADPEDVIVVSIKPMSSNDGLTLVTWSSFGSLYDARVFFSSRSHLRDARIVTHEMLHALGFGHTTAWRSVMNPGGSGVAGLTAHDVAYVQASLAWRAQYERADMWSRLALAVSREPLAQPERNACEMFSPPVRFPGECKSCPCSSP